MIAKRLTWWIGPAEGDQRSITVTNGYANLPYLVDMLLGSACRRIVIEDQELRSPPTKEG